MGIGGRTPDPRPAVARAALRLAALVLLVCALGVLTCGCRPPADCDVGRDTWRCSPEGIPQHCDAHNRWRAWATVPCARVGLVCALRDGRTTCVRPSTAAAIPSNPFNDAGADASVEGGL